MKAIHVNNAKQVPALVSVEEPKPEPGALTLAAQRRILGITIGFPRNQACCTKKEAVRVTARQSDYRGEPDPHPENGVQFGASIPIHAGFAHHVFVFAV